MSRVRHMVGAFLKAALIGVAATWLAGSLSPGRAHGAVTVSFPTSPSADTVYDYYYGYPYMMVAGDTVTGYRTSTGLPAVNSMFVDIYVDQTYLYCDTYLDFYFDGNWVGDAYLDSYYWWTWIYGSVPVDLTNAEDHTIEMVLYYDANWCVYPNASFIMFDEVNSTVTMDLVGADEDGDGYYAEAYYGDDCNDRDASVHPGASEVCNGVDDNCNGRVDEGLLQTYYRDADNDGYGDASDTANACSAPSGYVSTSGDCDDSSAAIHPGATEACNSVDDDCDGQVDEGLLDTFYQDDDGDGYGVTASAVQACSAPSGYVSISGDCDDTQPDDYPGAPEQCDGRDNDCDGLEDEGVTTTYYQDADGDGFGSGTTAQACSAPNGYVATNGDCDDTNPTINPGAAEQCDGVDNDCDGAVDEGVSNTYYRDGDGDGFGDTSVTTQACSLPDGYATTAGDCDDGNASVYPSAPEQCDGIDNDCDGSVDEGVTTIYYQDADRDDYGDPGSTVSACSPPTGYVTTAGDCDDSDSTVHPGADETCNEVDDDCDGSVDEGVTTVYYQDADGDDYGDPGSTASACSPPTGYVGTAGDCDDSDSSVHPGADEVCNDQDDDCDGMADEGLLEPAYRDADGDGYGTGADTVYVCTVPDGYTRTGGDCDDSDAAIYPSADEQCDGKDNDCDGVVDEDVRTEFYQDADGDGYGVATLPVLACDLPEGYAATAGDCNDADSAIHPDAPEDCNGLDDDCDGSIDEGVTNVYHPDRDEDGYGSSASSTNACSPPNGYVEDGTDCRDNDPDSHPGALEVCDEVDNDCDGEIDEGVLTVFYLDEDRDGYGNSTESEEACDKPAGYAVTGTDCDDTDPSIHPGAREDCDGIDNDCDGTVDEDVQQTFYQDADGDGYGTPDTPTTACALPDGYSANDSDCDDTDSNVYPGALEVCNTRDDDCDGDIDEDVTLAWFADADEDGYGDPGDETWACSAPDGRVSDDTDCDDTDPSIHPGADETCGDGIDQDCDSYDLGCDAVDNDGDTFSEVDGDCDDTDPAVHPGADEVCDGIDNDCSGTPDDIDQDGDGFIDAACQGDDCDDTDPAVYPGANEVCDGTDNDCSGAVDDRDIDEDGYVAQACGGGDCDDADPLVHPHAEELCDGIDNDCSGTIDDRDADGDGYVAQACGGDDCDDIDATVHPDADELPNGVDDDCDGISDENTGVYDDDGDGYSEADGDCNDTDPDISPGAEEVPGDGVDNDCDGEIDEPMVTPTPWPVATPTPEVAPSPTLEPSPALTPTPGPTLVPTSGPEPTTWVTPTPAVQATPGPWETPVPGATPTPLEPTPWLAETATPGLEPTPTPSDLPPSSETPPLSDVPTPSTGGEGCACTTTGGFNRPGAGAVALFLGVVVQGVIRRRRRGGRRPNQS